MTFRELENWRTKHNVADTWWVSVSGVVQDTTYALADILQIKSQSPDLHVAVLNNIYANHQNPTWVDLTLQAVSVTRPPTAAAAAEPVKVATAKAEPVAVAAVGIPADFLEKFNALQTEVEALKREVTALRKIADTYKDSFAEAKAILDEREAFLEMSEAQLFEKAQSQEVRNTELDQLKDNLDKREALLKSREG